MKKSSAILVILITALINYDNQTLGDELADSIKISNAAVKVQSNRAKIISQNIANINTTATNPNDDPYRRKIIFFKNEVEPNTNTPVLSVSHISEDKSDFILKYEPNHPAADAQGYVKYPNIKLPIEISDLKETEIAIDANLSSISITQNNINKIINMLH